MILAACAAIRSRLASWGGAFLRAVPACACSAPTRVFCLLLSAPASLPGLCAQTRKMVHEKHVQTGAALETCVDELQRDFESAMETVMSSIRAKHGVTEQLMTHAMRRVPFPTLYASIRGVIDGALSVRARGATEVFRACLKDELCRHLKLMCVCVGGGASTCFTII